MAKSFQMGRITINIFVGLTVLLFCSTFLVQFTIFKSVHNGHPKALSEEGGENHLHVGMSGDLSILVNPDPQHHLDLDTVGAVVVPTDKNFYISAKRYVARQRPSPHIVQMQKQPSVPPESYKIIGELARRYGAKYIIDIGCGTGKYLAQLAHEFHVIGIDYGINLERAQQSFPELTFIDANLDRGKSCSVSLPEDILFQSVVISADVIEHLVDPMYCFMRVLKRLSAYASAVVLTTPDRKRLSTVFHWHHRDSGPPVNKHHVREWTISELTHMFKDIGMYVIMSSWMCGRSKGCSSGFSIEKNPYVNQLHILGNTNVGRVWQDKTLPINTKLTTFIIVHPKTNPSLLNATVNHLAKQGSDVFLFLRKCNISISSNPAILGIRKLNKTTDAFILIKTVMFSETFNFRYGDWFMLQDANEIISIPAMYQVFNYTLRQFLQYIAYEPFGFNAVPITTLAMNSQKVTKSKDKLPFRTVNKYTWDDHTGKLHYPQINALEDKVRIWRKTYRAPRFFTSFANHTGLTITDVHFLGRRVYPFHLQSLRYSLFARNINTNISLELSQMYGLDIGVGYSAFARKITTLKRLPY